MKKEIGLLPNRIRISNSATELLKQIKSRTGITPNLLARFALAYSIEHSVDGSVEAPDTLGSEFNVGTLLGDFELHFACLLRQRHGEVNEAEFASIIAGHIDKGMPALRRIRSPADLLSLIPA